MKTKLQKNTIASTLILYAIAVLLFTASPPLVYAAEEGTQTESSPSNSTPLETVSSEADSEEAASEEQTAEETASTESSQMEESSTPENSSIPAQKPNDSTNDALQDNLPQQESPSNTAVSNPTESSFAVTPMQAIVYAATQSGLNVRSGPSTSYDKIGILKYGQEITVTGKTDDDWYQISYSNGYGYVSMQYVSDTPLTSTDITDTEVSLDDITDVELATEQDTDISSDKTEMTSNLFGTPVMIILAIAIFGVIALIVYSVYGLFKKDDDNDSEYDEEYFDDEYYEDSQDEEEYNDEEEGIESEYEQNKYNNEYDEDKYDGDNK